MGVEQRRRVQIKPIVNTRADGVGTVTGYAAVFYDANDTGTEYRLWSDMVERIRPGAFDRAIREDDVRALFNHDPNQVVGRNRAGTLRLLVDARGLKYEIDPPDTQAGRDLVTSLKRGDIDGSSFSFVPLKTTWEEVRDAVTGTVTAIRWIDEAQLYDVGPVTFPAYTGTAASARNDEDTSGVRDEFEAWRRAVGQPPDSDLVAIALADMDMILADCDEE
jgi:uncharacterized protein